MTIECRIDRCVVSGVRVGDVDRARLRMLIEASLRQRFLQQDLPGHWGVDRSAARSRRALPNDRPADHVATADAIAAAIYEALA